MNRLTQLAMLGLLASAAGAAVHTSYSYVGDKKYTFEVDSSEIEAGPSWDPATRACAPLASREAIEAARRVLSDLFADSDQWSLDHITLYPVPLSSHWTYEIGFMKLTPTDPPMGQEIPAIRIPVLLNGRAIEPIVSPWSGDYLEDLQLEESAPPEETRVPHHQPREASAVR